MGSIAAVSETVQRLLTVFGTAAAFTGEGFEFAGLE